MSDMTPVMVHWLKNLKLFAIQVEDERKKKGLQTILTLNLDQAAFLANYFQKHVQEAGGANEDAFSGVIAHVQAGEEEAGLG